MVQTISYVILFFFCIEKHNMSSTTTRDFITPLDQLMTQHQKFLNSNNMAF